MNDNGKKTGFLGRTIIPGTLADVFVLPWPRARLHFIERLVRDLAILARNGMDLVEGVKCMALSEGKASERLVLIRLHERLQTGMPVWEAIRKGPVRYFRGLNVDVIRAGEVNGALAEGLELAANTMRSYLVTRKRMRQLLFLPLLMVPFMLLIAGTIATFVIPQMVEFYNQGDAQTISYMREPVPEEGEAVRDASVSYKTLLPRSTGFLYRNSSVSMEWMKLLFFLGLVLMVLTFHLRGFGVRFRFVPGLSGLCSRLNQAHTLGLAGLLLKRRVPPETAFHNASVTLVRAGIGDRVRAAVARMREGKGIAESLAAERAVDDSALFVIRAGERGEDLPERLIRFAEKEEAEVQERMVQIFMVLRILVYCLLGVVIAIFAISVYEPLFGVVRLITEGF